eukprot:scaffold2177_cov272-Pinguiococcus_pyrenoidosus.AAC.13
MLKAREPRLEAAAARALRRSDRVQVRTMGPECARRYRIPPGVGIQTCALENAGFSRRFPPRTPKKSTADGPSKPG